MLNVLLITSLVVLVAASPSLAQTPKLIRKFKAWGEYRYQSKNGPVCYALTVPLTKQPSNVDHGDNFFMVSNQPQQGVKLQPELKAGYELRSDKVVITVGDRKFPMITKDDRAWPADVGDRTKLLARLRSSHEMTVEAVSKRGTKTRYSYSLTGSSAALKAIEECQ